MTEGNKPKATEPHVPSPNNNDDEKAAVPDQDYGYEELDKPTEIPNQSRKVQRRNVVKADEAIYNLSYHPGRVLAYSPPRQRQKWGEAQSLPRVNWGDLFFDLHYVAATYNISYQLVYDPTFEGLLYAAGTFFPIQAIWTKNTLRSSRFVTEDDLFHRALQICQLVILATGVLHIRPVKVMSKASEEISMFVFCLCMVLDLVLEAFRCTEEYFLGIGHKKGVQNASLVQLFNVFVTSLFYVPALVVAGLEFFPRHSSSSEYDRLLAGDSGYENAYDAYGEDKASSPTYSTTNLPILLLLVGYWATTLFLGIRVVYCFPKNGKHKDIMIPINVGFVIHRMGEFIMLMLGESIFSIVTVYVPNEDRDFFFTFYCCVITVVLLQFVHFQSQPHDADSHALRRHKDAGIVWSNLINIYSFALVCLGAAFTFFLTSFSYDKHRRLAGGESYASDPDTEEERSAHLFCGALAVCFAALDGMTAAHVGIEEGKGRLVGNHKKNIAGIVLVGIRLAIIPFTATLSQWETKPTRLSMIGLICVLTQLVLRKLGDSFLCHEQVHAMDPHATTDHNQHSPHLRQSVLLASAWQNMVHEIEDPSKDLSAAEDASPP